MPENPPAAAPGAASNQQRPLVQTVTTRYSKPAVILENVCETQPRFLITDSWDRARKIHRHLAKPYREQLETGVIAYDRSATIETKTDVAVVERGATTKTTITPDGRKRLWVNTAAVVEVPINEPLRPDHLKTPIATRRIDNSDDSYIVTDRAGTELGRYDSRNALSKDWTVIQRPFIPRLRNYLRETTVYYPDDDELVKFTPPYGATRSERLEELATRFLEDCTIKTTVTPIDFAELCEAFETYYGAHVSDDELNRTWSERALTRSNIEIQTREDGCTKYLPNRAWVVPGAM